MKKMKRVNVIREVLEAKLKKNERRIQAIAEASYKLRLMIEQVDSIAKQTPYVKPKEGEEGVVTNVAELAAANPVEPLTIETKGA